MTALSITTSPNPSVAGQPITLTINVSADQGGHVVLWGPASAVSSSTPEREQPDIGSYSDQDLTPRFSWCYENDVPAGSTVLTVTITPPKMPVAYLADPKSVSCCLFYYYMAVYTSAGVPNAASPWTKHYVKRQDKPSCSCTSF